MAENALVSVVIPYYNRKQYLLSALEQLKRQTLKNIQFIMIDDGSSDDSYEYLRRKAGKDKRFTLLKLKTNSGPSVARNTALKYVKGAYLGYFDIDDSVPADYFEKLYNTAVTTGADIVYTNYKGVIHCTDKHEADTLADKFAALKNGAIWDKLFKFSKVKDIRFAEGLYCADNVYLSEALVHSGKMVLINEPLYEYNIRNDSISFDKAKQQKRQADILTVVNLVKKVTEAEDAATKKEVVNFLLRSLSGRTLSAECQQKFYAALGVSAKEHKQNQEVKPTMKLGMLKIVRMFHLISKTKYNEKRQAELIKHSKLFDAKWYLANNPDVKAKKMSAAKHYIKHGWKEGRNPSQHFDGNAYLAANPDVAASGMNPLVHYILCGANEGRCFYPVTGEGILPSECGFTRGCGMAQKIRNMLNYPMLLQSECERLKAEIAEIKKSL